MENTILIIVISVIFASFAWYLLVTKKIPFINKDNKNVDVTTTLSNVAVILTLFYGIFSFTHSIYPVFQKENALKAAEQKVVKLNDLLDNERTSRESVENKLDDKTKSFEDLNKQFMELQNDKFTLENDYRILENKSKSNERQAVFNLILLEVNKIIDHYIYAVYTDVNIQQEILECVNRNLKIDESQTDKTTSNESIENKAYLILKKFAEDKLSPSSTYKEALEIYTYFWEVCENY